jgi:hypothetical protein
MIVDPHPPRDHAAPQQVRTLDEERAASMADEGGVSAAYMDAHERGELGRESRWQAPTWLPWALAMAGAFLLGRYARA